VLDDGRAVLDGNDGGLHKVSLRRKVGTLLPGGAAVQHLRATKNRFSCVTACLGRMRRCYLAALGLCSRDRVHKHLNSRGIVQRPHERAGRERVADGNGAVRLDELRYELIVHFFMDVQAAQRGAALARGPDL
jgi:hypothetical protein